ncbi:hypothetical protein G9A89_014328 [Geosiphon pyriformis]|nr:hypothetical protein G9A89_014328 [Geosiphon pyriformis]
MAEVSITVILSFLLTAFTYISFAYIFVHFLLLNDDKKKSNRHNQGKHRKQSSFSTMKASIVKQSTRTNTTTTTTMKKPITNVNTSPLTLSFVLPKGIKPLPGPTSLPVIGNLHQLSDPLHMTLNDWAQIYGPIFQIRMGSKVWVILNDHQIANKLFLEKSDIYQPSSSNLLISSTPLSLTARSLAQQALSQKTVETNYTPIVHKQTKSLMRHFYKYSNQTIDPSEALGEFVSKTFSTLTFGSVAEKFSDDFSQVLELTKSLESKNARLEALPFLRSFTSSPKLESEARESVLKFQEVSMNLAATLKNRNAKKSPAIDKSFVSQILRSMKSKNSIDDHELMNLNTNFLFNGTDYTIKEIKWVFLLLSYAPQVQKRIQQELLKVVGKGKLPEANDYANLPYLRATIKEIMRFRPVGFFSKTYTATKDDIYGNLHIPLNSTVILNTNFLHFSPSVFERPKRFSPERFLDSNGNLKEIDSTLDTWLFGKGPNENLTQHLTEILLSCVTTFTLSLFNIQAEIDQKTGEEVDINLEGISRGLELDAPEFKIILEPREDVLDTVAIIGRY